MDPESSENRPRLTPPGSQHATLAVQQLLRCTETSSTRNTSIRNTVSAPSVRHCFCGSAPKTSWRSKRHTCRRAEHPLVSSLLRLVDPRSSCVARRRNECCFIVRQTLQEASDQTFSIRSVSIGFSVLGTQLEVSLSTVMSLNRSRRSPPPDRLCNHRHLLTLGKTWDN